MTHYLRLKLITGMLFVISTVAIGQRIEKNEVRLTYVKMPLAPLPKEIQTYTARIQPGDVSFKFIHLKNQNLNKIIQIEAGSNDNYGSVSQSEKDFLILPGYKKVAENGDLKIDVLFKKLVVNNKKMKTGTGQITEGNQMVARTLYFYEFDYSYFGGVVISTLGADTIYRKVYNSFNGVKAIYGSCGDCKQASDGPAESFGGAYTSQEELEESFKQRFLSELEIKWTRDALLDVKDYLNSVIGKPSVYTDFTILSGKGKLSYTDLDTALAKMTTAAETLSSKDDKLAAEPLINEAISIWQKALEESNITDKKARINEEITIGLYYNIGIANAWLNKFDTCREWFDKAAKVKDGARLVNDVKWWVDSQEKRLKANAL